MCTFSLNRGSRQQKTVLDFRKCLILFHMMLKIICQVGPGFMTTLTLLKISEDSLVAQR